MFRMDGPVQMILIKTYSGSTSTKMNLAQKMVVYYGGAGSSYLSLVKHHCYHRCMKLIQVSIISGGQEPLSKPGKPPQKHPGEWPEKPWTRVHIDYAGPFMGAMLFVITRKLGESCVDLLHLTRKTPPKAPLFPWEWPEKLGPECTLIMLAHLWSSQNYCQ